MMKIILAWFLFCPLLALAHQPVMDMAPRWQQGYGFQTRYEHYGSAKLRHGDASADNPLALERFVQTLWFEGVYTFHRAVRATFKLPYIHQRRRTAIGGSAISQTNSGAGDLILGLPLKYYRNHAAFTENIGLTPSIRLPTGSTAGVFPLGDGSTDIGLSLSYSSESPKYYSLFDLYYWRNTQGAKGMHAGDEFGLDINLGYHPIHSNEHNAGVFIMWDISARHHAAPSSATLTTAAGGQRLQSGPVLVLYKNNLMLRAEYKHLLHEQTDGISHSRGAEFSLGLGMTF